MRREDAERLINHHYRLCSGSVRAVVDCSPPISLYNSPKSTYYRPFALREPHRIAANSSSSSGLNQRLNEEFLRPTLLDDGANAFRRRGKEELAHFLSHRRAQRASSLLGFNAYAQPLQQQPQQQRWRRPASVCGADAAAAATRSKLLDNRNYQPPLSRKLNAATASAAEASTLKNLRSLQPPPPPPPLLLPRRRANNNDDDDDEAASRLYEREYACFKDRVLNEILVRDVFTDRVIEDCFLSEMAKRPDIDARLLAAAMRELLVELGVEKASESQPPSIAKSSKRVTISEPRRRRSAVSIDTRSSTTTTTTTSGGGDTASSSSSSASAASPAMRAVDATSPTGRSSGAALTTITTASNMAVDRRQEARRASGVGRPIIKLDAAPPSVSTISSDAEAIESRRYRERATTRAFDDDDAISAAASSLSNFSIASAFSSSSGDKDF